MRLIKNLFSRLSNLEKSALSTGKSIVLSEREHKKNYNDDKKELKSLRQQCNQEDIFPSGTDVNYDDIYNNARTYKKKRNNVKNAYGKKKKYKKRYRHMKKLIKKTSNTCEDKSNKINNFNYILNNSVNTLESFENEFDKVNDNIEESLDKIREQDDLKIDLELRGDNQDNKIKNNYISYVLFLLITIVIIAISFYILHVCFDKKKKVVANFSIIGFYLIILNAVIVLFNKFDNDIITNNDFLISNNISLVNWKDIIVIALNMLLIFAILMSNMDSNLLADLFRVFKLFFMNISNTLGNMFKVFKGKGGPKLPTGVESNT